MSSQVWPGATLAPDWFHPNTTTYWTSMLKTFYQQAAFRGLWIDMNEMANFCGGEVRILNALLSSLFSLSLSLSFSREAMSMLCPINNWFSLSLSRQRPFRECPVFLIHSLPLSYIIGLRKGRLWLKMRPRWTRRGVWRSWNRLCKECRSVSQCYRCVCVWVTNSLYLELSICINLPLSLYLHLSISLSVLIQYEL